MIADREDCTADLGGGNQVSHRLKIVEIGGLTVRCSGEKTCKKALKFLFEAEWGRKL